MLLCSLPPNSNEQAGVKDLHVTRRISAALLYVVLIRSLSVTPSVGKDHIFRDVLLEELVKLASVDVDETHIGLRLQRHTLRTS